MYLLQSQCCILSLPENRSFPTNLKMNISQASGRRASGQRIVFEIQFVHSARWSHEEGRKFSGGCGGRRHDGGLSSWSKRELAKQCILLYIGSVRLCISTIGGSSRTMGSESRLREILCGRGHGFLLFYRNHGHYHGLGKRAVFNCIWLC
jgi:hypothetical protein